MPGSWSFQGERNAARNHTRTGLGKPGRGTPRQGSAGSRPRRALTARGLRSPCHASFARSEKTPAQLARSPAALSESFARHKKGRACSCCGARKNSKLAFWAEGRHCPFTAGVGWPLRLTRTDRCREAGLIQDSPSHSLRCLRILGERISSRRET